MPIYEYRCTQCTHAFEVLQRVNEPVPAQCPDCGHGRVEKQVSRTSFRLKGTGWYETDFKSAKATPAAEKTVDSTVEPASKATVKKQATATSEA